MSPSSSLSGEHEVAGSKPVRQQSRRARSSGNARWALNPWVAGGFALSLLAQLLNDYRVALVMMLGALLGILIDSWARRA